MTYDPVVLAHDRALLAGADGIAVVDGDARHADEFAADPDLRTVIDFTRPVASLFVAVLHFVRDGEDPWGNLAFLRGLMAPGQLSRALARHQRRQCPRRPAHDSGRIRKRRRAGRVPN